LGLSRFCNINSRTAAVFVCFSGESFISTSIWCWTLVTQALVAGNQGAPASLLRHTTPFVIAYSHSPSSSEIFLRKEHLPHLTKFCSQKFHFAKATNP
jgi:hypothetical protein